MSLSTIKAEGKMWKLKKNHPLKVPKMADKNCILTNPVISSLEWCFCTFQKTSRRKGPFAATIRKWYIVFCTGISTRELQSVTVSYLAGKMLLDEDPQSLHVTVQWSNLWMALICLLTDALWPLCCSVTICEYCTLAKFCSFLQKYRSFDQ